MQKYSTQELMLLINKLPIITQSKGPKMISSVIAGFTARLQNRFRLIDAEFDGGKLAGFRPDPKIDLRTTNSFKRRLISFGSANHVFRQSLNRELAGGESYPVLGTFGGIGLGLVSGPAGIAFSLGVLLLDQSRTVQPVRARAGDEIWHVEQLARQGNNVYHVEYFVLIDPYRRLEVNQVQQEWIVHEERRRINWAEA